MAIYKPSELREFLFGLGISPKKSLSQNFLIDGNVTRNIIKASQVEPGDVVLEIGPGPGPLTEALLETGATVIAVERDEILAKALERLGNKDNCLHVFCEDIMEFPIEKTLKEFLPKNKKAKVIANLPYHLTSAIIEKLVQMPETILSLTLMVQDEVARRYTAKPSTKAYSSFTVFLNFHAKAEYAFSVSNNCFFPPPKVNSAVVVLSLEPSAPIPNIDDFFKMTQTAFKQRRKMLKSSLRELYPIGQTELALKAIGCKPTVRPEELSLEQFLKLFEWFSIFKPNL